MKRPRSQAPQRHATQIAARRRTLPPHPPTAGALALLDLSAVEAEPTRKLAAAGKMILIIEDNPHMAALIQECIVQDGEPDWTVRSAAGGLPALELADATPPDVVLLDVCLPDLDGAEVYNRLRESDATRGARVLFLSACTQTDLWQRGIVDGVLLRKPFDLRELVAILRALLQG